MKTKYIRVKASERLPRLVRTDVIVLWKNEEETYSAGTGFFTEKGYWWVYDSGCSVPEYWLEEVPDYEDEMREMLEELLYDLENKEDPWRTVENHEKIKSLLTKLKTES